MMNEEKERGKRFSTKYTGVYGYLTKSTGDLIYYIAYKLRDGRLKWEKVGRVGHGYTAKYASELWKQRSAEQIGDPKKAPIDNNLTLRGAFEMWRDYAVGNRKKGVQSYVSRWKTHIEPTFGDMRMDEITPGMIDKAKIKWLETLSPTTVNQVIKQINVFYRYAIKRDKYEGDLPTKHIKLFPDGEHARQRYLTLKEALALLQLAKEEKGNPGPTNGMKDPELYEKILVALHTGIRRRGLMNLKVRNVDLSGGIITISDKIRGKVRHVPINKIVKPVLEELMKGKGREDFIFQYQELPLYQWRLILEKAGLNDGLRTKDQQNKVVWHTLRHTFASWLVQGGESLPTVQKLMGHENIAQTMVYAKLAPSQTFDASFRLADRFEKGEIL